MGNKTEPEIPVVSGGGGEAAYFCPGQSVKPEITSDLAIKLIQRHFGHNVEHLKQLDGYHDVNYLAVVNSSVGTKEKFVFKILNSRDSTNTAHIYAQHEAMGYLNSKGFQCPTHQHTTEGELFCMVSIPDDSENSKIHVIRLLSYVEGVLLSDVKPTESVLIQAGSFVGRVQQELKEFTHPGLDHVRCIWFLTAIPELRQYLHALDHKPKRQSLAQCVIKSFEETVMPLHSILEKGVIHGDAFTHNILCRRSSENTEYELHGLIDFGAVHEGCYVYELAIIMCYMMLECLQHHQGQVDPLTASGHVLRGYLKERNVPEIEMNILRTCIAGRLCQSLVLGAYTYSQDPSNVYALTTSKAGWSLLERLWIDTTDEQMQGIWANVERNMG